MDEKRLEDLLAAHAGRIFNYCRRMGADRESARDFVQETLLRALRAARRYRGEAPVEVWLLGIARNVFREWLRSRREELGTELEPSDPGPSAESVDVQRALLALAPEHREVLVLRFVLDQPGEAVAALLGISHEALRQRVARAKAEFRKTWEA